MPETTIGSRVGPAVVVVVAGAAAAAVVQLDGTGIVAAADREASNHHLLRHFRSATVVAVAEAEAGGIAAPIFTFPRVAGIGTIPLRRRRGRARRGTRRPPAGETETETTMTRIAITPREAGTEAEVGGGERLLRGTTRRGSSRRTGEACTAAVATATVLGEVRRAVLRGACLNVSAVAVAAEEEGVARLRAGVRRRRRGEEEVGEVLPIEGDTSELPL